jgi:hypothetical protein
VAFPVAKVYIAFNDGPYEPSPTWTDVTSYVRQINIQRGRTDELSDFESGNATVVLDNRDRRFDPFYTSGPYYGTGTSIVPRRQIKIEAYKPTDPYPVFRGFVEGWPVTITDAGFDATVTVQCFDALGLLADEELPDDISSNYILSLSPRHYWPLDDPIDPETYTTAQLKDLGSSPKPLVPFGTFRTANGPGLAPALPNTCLQVSETEFEPAWTFDGSPMAATVSTAVGWYIQGTGTNFIILQYSLSHQVEYIYDVTLDTSTVNIYDGTTQRSYSATTYLDANIAHHVAIVVNSNATLQTLYIDGQAVTTTLTSTAFAVSGIIEDLQTGAGRKQQLAIFTTQLTSTQVKTIYRLGRSLLTEGTVARFNRLIGYTPFPSALTSTPSAAYSATVAEIGAGGPPVTEELQILADSEGGNLYVSKNGTLTLTSRMAIFEGLSLTSNETFGGANISIGTEIAYRLDANNLRNTLAVGYSGDGSIEVSNAASITAYGTAGGSWNTQLSTVDDAQSLGNLLVGFSATPAVVIDPIEVNVAANDDDWNRVLSLELLNRITLNIVQKVGSTLTFSQILQSITHTITPSQWSTTINGSVRFTNPFVIGTSLIGGTDLIT